MKTQSKYRIPQLRTPPTSSSVDENRSTHSCRTDGRREEKLRPLLFPRRNRPWDPLRLHRPSPQLHSSTAHNRTRRRRRERRNGEAERTKDGNPKSWRLTRSGSLELHRSRPLKCVADWLSEALCPRSRHSKNERGKGRTMNYIRDILDPPSRRMTDPFSI